MRMEAKQSGGRVLIADDEPAILKTFRYCLEEAGYEVSGAAGAEQLEALVQRQVFDLCFLDLKFGSASGLELLPRLKAAAPWLRITIVTAYSSIDTAVQAIHAGAVDYLVKPCSSDQLRLAAAKHMQARRLELRLEELERGSPRPGEDAQLDSRSPAMRQVVEMAREVADSDANLLILGESGTGKGVLARAVHRWSGRGQHPFVTVNSPGLSAELFESELFGHRKGAFTGAIQNSPGRVSQADGGTLFLDEVGDVPPPLQPKLLRFLQDKEYERVGDPLTRYANVRLVAATNRDLHGMVRQGQFREDLLYRLDVIRLLLPALRERPEDIPALAQHFLAQFAALGRRARGFTTEALALLTRYAWPGNVRELRNVIERASILCKSELIEPRFLALDSGGSGTAPRPGAALSLSALEREHIVAVLAQAGTLEAAARQLGIDASTLYRKRKQYGI